MKYQLLDVTTADMVGYFDTYREVVDVLRYDLDHNGPDSLLALVLITDPGDGFSESLDGEQLLEIARTSLPAPRS